APAPESRSTHRVWRDGEWLPCYCLAGCDHGIGSEQMVKRDPAPVASAADVEPSDEEIDAIAASMPDGLGGMLKQWGYRQFARALLARYGNAAAHVHADDARDAARYRLLRKGAVD